MRQIRWAPALAGIALAAVLVTPHPNGVARVRVMAATIHYYIDWVSVNPLYPRTVIVAGTRQLVDQQHDDLWIMRSADGGATWIDLTEQVFGAGHSPQVRGPDTFTLAPLVVGPDGTHLSMGLSQTGGAGRLHTWYDLLLSGDRGLTWTLPQTVTETGIVDYHVGFTAAAFGPLGTTRLYAVDPGNGPDGGPDGNLYVSDTDGLQWRAVQAASIQQPSGVVADPRRRDTVYVVDAGPSSTQSMTVTWQRSDDAGATWSVLRLPHGLGAARFALSIDPHLGATLVGQSTDARLPSDRRFLSSDGGRTWSAATCAGDLAGACPAFVVDNVFGTRRSYGFYPRGPEAGIHAFTGGGLAGPRLSLSDRLPVPLSAISAVGGGLRAGDPVYVASRVVSGTVQGALYRSDDAGASWRPLVLPLVPPSLLPASRAPTALYVAAARHSVDTPFVAAYQRWSALLGWPLTEAYTDTMTGARTQVFANLGLEVRNGRVVFAALGAQALADEGLSFHRVAPVARTTTRLYFPQTGHTLQGDMLRYWQAHGGLTVLGPPISEMVGLGNGVNGRFVDLAYPTQWFVNARLERHRGPHGEKVLIQLGALGTEALDWKGWTTQASPNY